MESFRPKLNNTTESLPPVGNGQLTFWAKYSCAAGGNITVKLSNNQTGANSSFTANEPACGAAGTASFTLPAGAIPGRRIAAHRILHRRIDNHCQSMLRQEIFFAAPIDCRISDIAFYDYATNEPM